MLFTIQEQSNLPPIVSFPSLSAISFKKLSSDWEAVLVQVDDLNGHATQLPNCLPRVCCNRAKTRGQIPVFRKGFLQRVGVAADLIDGGKGVNQCQSLEQSRAGLRRNC